MFIVSVWIYVYMLVLTYIFSIHTEIYSYNFFLIMIFWRKMSYVSKTIGLYYKIKKYNYSLTILPTTLWPHKIQYCVSCSIHLQNHLHCGW